MSNHRSRRILAVAGAVLLLAIVTTGCGRRAEPADAAAGSPSAEMPASTAVAVRTNPTESVGPESPVPGPADGAGPTEAPAPQPTHAPLATPDLIAIEQLLVELDAALGADATADTDEGSAN